MSQSKMQSRTVLQNVGKDQLLVAVEVKWAVEVEVESTRAANSVVLQGTKNTDLVGRKRADQRVRRAVVRSDSESQGESQRKAKDDGHHPLANIIRTFVTTPKPSRMHSDLLQRTRYGLWCRNFLMSTLTNLAISIVTVTNKCGHR
jgi:hypothetical protein